MVVRQWMSRAERAITYTDEQMGVIGAAGTP
jgi:hypothetical protein